MKKTQLFIKNNILEVYVIFNILYLLIMTFLYAIHVIPFLKSFSFGLIELLILNAVIIVLINIKKYIFHKVDISVLFIIIFLIMSTIFAYKPQIALFGNETRYEGLFTILYYFSLFYICTYCKNPKKIIYMILFTGFVQFFVGLYQLCGVLWVKKPSFIHYQWILGLTTNPNFYGAYMMMCLCLAIGLFIDEKNKIVNVFILILICLFMSGLLFSNTLSSLVGLIVALFVLLIYSIKNKKIFKYFTVCLLLLLTFFVTNKIGVTSLFKDLIQTKNETINIARGEIKDSYGTARVYVWKRAIKYIPRHIVHGVGVSNFVYINNGKAIKKKNHDIVFTYDKAHNEYLHILITTGIFGLISLIIFHFIILANGFKNTFNNQKIYLLLPVVAYLTNLMFSFSVIEVTPIFYILMGLLINRNNDLNIYKSYIKRLMDMVFSIIMLVILLPVNIIIIILIKLIDKDEIIFKQLRTGLNGKSFYIYKYKTMKNNKLTKLGNILRKTSLDELPQFVNVLKGDMSIIGPRPWLVNYYHNFNDYQKKRNDIRPGMIGLAQVIGRNNISIFDKINFDIYYVDHISFLLDIKILFSTFKVIFIKDDIKDMTEYIDNEIKTLKNSKDFSLEVLLLTTNLNKKDLTKRNINSKCTVINQCNKKRIEKYKNFTIYNEREISKNKGIKYVKENIIILCDSNVIFEANYEELVLNEFRKNPFADIIVFNLESSNKYAKINKRNKRLHNYNSLDLAFSIIVFKREKIMNNNIEFNTIDDTDVVYSQNENVLFLAHCLKKGLKIYSVNITIGKILNDDSSYNIDNKKSS